jgi:hypothetical protein
MNAGLDLDVSVGSLGRRAGTSPTTLNEDPERNFKVIMKDGVIHKKGSPHGAPGEAGAIPRVQVPSG